MCADRYRSVKILFPGRGFPAVFTPHNKIPLLCLRCASADRTIRGGARTPGHGARTNRCIHTMAETRRPSRKLKSIDSEAFTLREHCGMYAKEVGQCFRSFDISDPDELASKRGEQAQQCQSVWAKYRSCGNDFIKTYDGLPTTCRKEILWYRACAGTARNIADCEHLELRALRCSATRIKLTMSGKHPPGALYSDGGD